MKNQPPIIIPDSIPVVPISTIYSANGVPMHSLVVEGDVVRVSFVFKAGTSRQSIDFSASATLNLLSEGSRDMDAQRIAEELDFYGSHFDVTIDRDYSVVTFCALSKFFEPTMAIASQILLHPIFPQSEIEVYCAKRKEALTLERTKVAFRSRELFAQALFGSDHPYGFSSGVEKYDALRRDDVVEFYQRFYTASNCFVVMSGRVDEAVLDSVDALVSQMPCGIQQNIVIPSAHPTIHIFEQQKGAVQSAIRMGLPFFNRNHPDYIAMQVLTTVLGGYFGSRLIDNLRQKHGYTYGVFAAMINLDEAGYMAIGTEVAVEATDDAVKQIFIEIERLRTEIVGQQELQTVKNIMAGEVMRILDGPFGIADVAIENIQNEHDNSYTSAFIEQVKNITAERLLQVAQKYLSPTEIVTVIVGEKS